MLSARPERRETNLRGGWSAGLKSRPYAPSGTAIIFAVAVAALYFAREIFVPLALAILLSFMLAPLVLLLRRLHLWRIPSVLVAVLVAFVVILGIGAFIGTQIVQLADNLPHYQITIKEKIRSVRASASGAGVVERASSMIRDLRSEITKDSDMSNRAATQLPKTAPGAGQQPAPIPVEIHEPPLAPLQLIQSVVGPLLQPLATAAMVFVFLLFILLQREDLRDRFIRLAGARDLQRTTQALDDGVGRLSRYFLMQSAINGIFGLLIGIGLFFIGVPNPVLWGIVAMLLRFVPYIGAPIAAVFPATLALAVDPGWSMLLWVVGLFAVIEPIMGQAVEPVLYGRSTGLSAVAVVVSAAFWTWLWGPLGLLLSTPLTVCLVVLGRHVERLNFLDVLLGDEPALTPEESFYQRVLAGDGDEAAHQAEEFLEHGSLSAYYDDVAIKGLALAQLDVNRGVLHHDRRAQIKETIDGLIDDLADHDGRPPVGAAIGEAQPDLPPRVPPQDASGSAAGQSSVLCVAGRGSLDEAAAAMLVDLLHKCGIAARVVPSPAVSAANIGGFNAGEAQTICLSYLEPGGFTSARYLARRLRRKLPRAKILLGLWTLGEAGGDHANAIKETGVEIVITSLGEAFAQIRKDRPETEDWAAAAAHVTAGARAASEATSAQR
jgi:predicted PurR-regulated permease PerM